MKDTEKHRQWLMNTLTMLTADIRHIKEKVDKNEQHLSDLNGRVRENQNEISFIKGAGSFVSILVGIFIAFLTKNR